MLAAQVRLLGTEHPSTLITACALALNHRLNGRFEDAESLYKKTLEVQKRTLGEKHPDTLKTMQMLGELKDEAGQDRRA